MTEFNMTSVVLESSREQGLTKRNVIIQKDSNGYGIRISGDNPVYIQHVNPDGSAYKAGVRSFDQIIKVNGTLVTKLGHTEVVKMIQSCGCFVRLTLLSSGPSWPDSVSFSDNSNLQKLRRITMDFKEEEEDGLTNNIDAPITPTSTLPPTNSKYFPISIDTIPVHSLRITRYLIQNQLEPPNALLFYTVTKHIFPTIVSFTLTSLTLNAAKQNIQRCAYQIVATWLVKDSPLFFHEYSQECFEQFDCLMNSFLAHESPAVVVNNLLDPFLDRPEKIVIPQLNQFELIVSNLNPKLLTTLPSEDLQATIEMLLVSPNFPINPSLDFGKVDISVIDDTVDQLISNANTNSVYTIAIVSWLLTIGNHLFGINSKHNIFQTNFKNIDSKINPKRNVVSLSSSFRIPNSITGILGNKDGSDLLGHSEAGHYFIPITEMIQIEYCSGCMLPIWDGYSNKCVKCLLISHLWCRKQTAVNYPCEEPNTKGLSSGAIASDSSTRKIRRNKSNKKNVFDKIVGTFPKQSDCSFSSTSGSSSDSTEEEDLAADEPKHQKMGTSQIQSNNQNLNDIRRSQSAGPVNRSGSFNQMKKSKSSPKLPLSLSEKRRNIQSEIVETEERHLEVLTYICSVYRHPLKKEKYLTKDQIDSIFANIKVIKKVHKNIYQMLHTAYLKDVYSETLVESCFLEQALKELFGGPLGKMLEQEISIFCANKKIGHGTTIWNQRKKDSKLKGLLDSKMRSKEMPGCELTRLCLPDLLSTVFQLPVRYPLLLKRLLGSTPPGSLAYSLLEQALNFSTNLVKNMDNTTLQAELKARLEEIIRKTTTTDCCSISSTILDQLIISHQLIHEGPLVWRITKQKFVNVLLVLTNQILLILTTSDWNDRYCLKQHTNPFNTKQPNKPTIPIVEDIMTRDVATDRSAFFLVSKSHDIIYEFAAKSQHSCKEWKDAIAKAINDYREASAQTLGAAQTQPQSISLS